MRVNALSCMLTATPRRACIVKKASTFWTEPPSFVRLPSHCLHDWTYRVSAPGPPAPANPGSTPVSSGQIPPCEGGKPCYAGNVH